MSLESVRSAPLPGVHPSLPSPPGMSVAWARVVGAGSIRRDFGYAAGTNGAGELLLAARLERIDGAAVGPDACAADAEPARSSGAVPTGRLLKLASGGGPGWTVLLRGAGPSSAPAVALDDAGAAYIAGPYEPYTAGLCASREVSLTKLAPGGAVDWTRPLLLVGSHADRLPAPVVRVAAAPAGGACVTWIGRRRGAPLVRALQFSSEGSIEWEHAWPISEVAFDPRVCVDGSGAAVFWGAFRGSVSFARNHAAQSHSEARYLVRVSCDGAVSWSQMVPVAWDVPCAVGVARSGAIGIATFVQVTAREGHAVRRGVTLLRADAAGGALKSLPAVCGANALISSLHVASSRDTFVLGGSFAGTLALDKVVLRSPTQAEEAVFVVQEEADGAISSLVLAVPQIWGGLSLHDAGGGAVLLAGWMCGTATFGEHRITSPRDRAVLFLAKLARS